MTKQLQKALTFLFALFGVYLTLGSCRADATSNMATSQQKPTIFIVGDSTARNNANGAQGWGDPFLKYFDPTKITVANRAMAGRSTRTYVAEGRWDNVLKELKAGDFVLIQMGHNDGGPVDTGRARASLPGLGEETWDIVRSNGSQEIVHTYGWYLRKFVTEAKSKEATPILMSLTVRNLWRDGKIRRDNGGFASWAQETAQDQNVPFVDVTNIIADRYDAMGAEAVKAMFGPDYVHTSPAGADLNAASVVAGLKAIPNSPILALLSEIGQAIEPYGVAGASKIAATGVVFPITGTPVAAAASNVATKAAAPVPATTPQLKPTLWLIGDSTMQVWTRGQLGWGTAFIEYFDPEKIKVENRGRGGRSSRSFRTEGLWGKVLEEMKPGDFVLIQFGHNDRGRPEGVYPQGRAALRSGGDETREVETTPGTKELVYTYGWYLRQYANEAKVKGATPIILSPIPYNRWTDGKAHRETEGFAKWSREAAQQTGVLFIDVNTILGDIYDCKGPENMAPLFADALHTNSAGADFNARGIIASIKRMPELAIHKYFASRAADIQPYESGTTP
jgi:lysophospholipase L1-like esterase